jgi:threonine dehydratase
VAALIAQKIQSIDNKRIAACVCGGNIDVNVMAQVIECGLVDSGRRVKLQVMLHDKPG